MKYRGYSPKEQGEGPGKPPQGGSGVVESTKTREGCPHAIERAMRAERAVKELKTIIYAIKMDSQSLKCTCGNENGRLEKSGFCEKCKVVLDIHCAEQVIEKVSGGD